MNGIRESQMSESAPSVIAPGGIEENPKRCKTCGKKCKSDRCKTCGQKARTGRFYRSAEWREGRKDQGNPNWKGDNVGYLSLHQWVQRRKPKPAFCEKCNLVKPYDLANISGEYKRDVNDYEWICRKCHMVSDGRLDKIHDFAMRNGGRKLFCVRCNREWYPMSVDTRRCPYCKSFYFDKPKGGKYAL